MTRAVKSRSVPRRGPWIAYGIAALFAGFFLTVSPALGQRAVDPTEAPPPIDLALGRLSIRGGLLFTEHSTFARVDSDLLGPGTLVDVERDLGLAEHTRDVRFDAAFRLGRRHQLQAGFLTLTRRGGTTLSRRLQWGDVVLSANADVQSRVKMTLVPLAYRYSILQTDRLDLGVSAGVFALYLDAGVTAPEVSVDEVGSANFPLPVVGVDGVAALFPRVFLTGGAKYFKLRIGGVEGSWRELRGALEVFPVAKAGLGVGYRLIRLEADDSEGILARPEGNLLYLDYEFAGPHLYVTLTP